jgi:hypothetical protein
MVTKTVFALYFSVITLAAPSGVINDLDICTSSVNQTHINYKLNETEVTDVQADNVVADVRGS